MPFQNVMNLCQKSFETNSTYFCRITAQVVRVLHTADCHDGLLHKVNVLKFTVHVAYPIFNQTPEQ